MSAGPMICVRCRLRIGHRRGLCDWCHLRLRRAVAEGKTTWAELERQGLVLSAEEGDYDTDEAEGPELAADLVGWFVMFGIGLFFAGAGLLLWAAALVPYWVMGMVFALGSGLMLLVLAPAVASCHGRAPPRGRE
jgi:hypothetical protein